MSTKEMQPWTPFKIVKGIDYEDPEHCGHSGDYCGVDTSGKVRMIDGDKFERAMAQVNASILLMMEECK